MDSLVIAQVENAIASTPSPAQAGDRFAAHLIPTDLVPGGSDETGKPLYLVRATVVFTPIPQAKVPQDKANKTLEQWPQWIADKFSRREISVLMRRAMSAEVSAEKVELAGIATSLFENGYSKIHRDRGTALIRLIDIWTDWFADMAGLREILSSSATQTAAQNKGLFQQEKPDTVAAGAAPDVISVPRAELARQLTLERARNLIEAVACAQSAASAQTVSQDRLARADARPGVDKRPWSKLPIGRERVLVVRALLGKGWEKLPLAKLRLANDLLSSSDQLEAEKKEFENGGAHDDEQDKWRINLKLAAAGKGPAPLVDVYEPFKYERNEPEHVKDRVWFEKLRTHLQDERNWLELTLATHLADQRQAARDHMQACQDCADACSSPMVDAASYLRKLEDQRQAHRATDVEATAKGVMGNEPDEAAAKNAAAQNASTLGDYGTEVPRLPLGAELRWNALQGMPALMRAMHLVVDIEFPVNAASLRDIAPALSGQGGLADAAHFVEFALDAGETEQRLWTLTKFRLPGNPDATGPHCWPATTEEWALRAASHAGPENTGFLDQVDAVIDLDAPMRVSGNWVRRYDVFSLDVTIASEAEQKRQAVEVQVKDGTPMPTEEQIGAIESSTLKTAGLQIVDRWRQAAVIDEIVTSCNAPSDRDRRLDANDLAIGYRLDVGLPKSGDPSSRNWASLSERVVHYQQEGIDDLDRIASAFSPVQPSNGVRLVDGATVAMGTRLLTNSQAGIAQSGKQTAFADQTVVVWDGDPIGVRTGSFKGQLGSNNLPVSQELALPNAGLARPHRLRFGAAYALGARSVLLGGVCIPLDQAAKLYDGGLGRGLAYPSSENEIQRFLRQERIGPPMVAVGDSLLIREFASERKGIDGKEMIVRSLPLIAGIGNEASAAWRFAPTETERVLLAPPVDLDFATMHGVYDQSASTLTTKPHGGLQDIDYDSDWGGFPVLDPKDPPIDSAIRGSTRAYERRKGDSKGNAQPVPSGFAAFRKRIKKDQVRNQEYYPDPAARYMVIALRRPEQPNGYLSGEAIRVPLYSQIFEAGSTATPGYPDARWVVLKVKTSASTKVPVLSSYDDLRARASEAGESTSAVKNGVRTVTIHLNPGEVFEVETWCLPEREHLRAWFDLPEAMALIMNCASSHHAVQCCQAVAGDDQPQKSDTLKLSVRRGEASIPWQDVRAAVSALYTALLKQPLPDIASVRRLKAIHAAGLPTRAPTGQKLQLLRLMPGTRGPRVLHGSVNKDDDGGSEIIALGSADFDPETTEALELHAEAPMPTGGPFDNLELGRTFEKRARGTWPRTWLNSDGDIEPIKVSGKDQLTYMSELFGFDVARDGTAELRRGQGLVARWHIGRLQQSPVELLALTAESQKAKRSSLETLFPDTHARRVSIWLAATSRTARQIPERPTYPTPEEAERDDRWLSAKGPKTDIILRATERPAALTPKSLLPSYVWSTEAAEPTRRAKIRIRLRRPWWTSGEDERLGIVVWPPNLMAAKDPTNDPHTGTWQASELKQGVIERLTPLAKNEEPLKLYLHELASTQDAPWREGFFTDADLGLGGAYVTRWGSDPIFASEDMAWLIDKAAFRDIKWGGTNCATPIDLTTVEGLDTGVLWPKDERHRPRFVENALMPIPEGDDSNKSDPNREGADQASSGTVAPKVPPEFMMISLVTYTPRFDPDFEHWYVDVDLDVGEARDPFVRFGLVRFQPHADRHLQVSQPVAEWVQVVGYLRNVTVLREGDWATICVGPATGVDTKRDPSAKSDQAAPGETPLIRATLIECRQSPHGQVLERVARLSKVEIEKRKLAGFVDDDADGKVIKTCQVSTGSSFLLDLQLPIPSDGEPQRLHYAVLVEELMLSQRSSYSNEPVRNDADILAGERNIESGRRFAVRIELERPPDLSDG